VSGSGISYAICKSAPWPRYKHTSIPPLSFVQAGCPATRPTGSKHWRLSCKFPMLLTINWSMPVTKLFACTLFHHIHIMCKEECEWMQHNFVWYPVDILMSSVLWRCWLGGRKGVQPVKTEWWDIGVIICLWGEVQICIWPSRCHCHSLSLAPVNPD